MLRYPTLDSLSLSLSLDSPSTTEKQQNVTFLIGYNSRTVKDDDYCRPLFDKYLFELFKNVKINQKNRVVMSWWRHKVWEHFFKNDKFSGKFFGQNSAFELKIDDIMQIDNCLSFPKHPSKSRLSLLIIEIIALKDKQYRPKTTKTVIELEVKPEHFCS